MYIICPECGEKQKGKIKHGLVVCQNCDHEFEFRKSNMAGNIAIIIGFLVVALMFVPQIIGQTQKVTQVVTSVTVWVEDRDDTTIESTVIVEAKRSEPFMRDEPAAVSKDYARWVLSQCAPQFSLFEHLDKEASEGFDNCVQREDHVSGYNLRILRSYNIAILYSDQ